MRVREVIPFGKSNEGMERERETEGKNNFIICILDLSISYILPELTGPARAHI